MTYIVSICALVGFDNFPVYFNTVVTRGSGSGDPERQNTSCEDICGIISTEVAMAVREAIPEVVGSIKITMIKMFDELYVAITQVVAATTTAVVATTRPH